jgi:hypothetical protein
MTDRNWRETYVGTNLLSYAAAEILATVAQGRKVSTASQRTALVKEAADLAEALMDETQKRRAQWDKQARERDEAQEKKRNEERKKQLAKTRAAMSHPCFKEKCANEIEYITDSGICVCRDHYNDVQSEKPFGIHQVNLFKGKTIDEVYAMVTKKPVAKKRKTRAR